VVAWNNKSLGWGGLAALLVAAGVALAIAWLPVPLAAALILGALGATAVLIWPQLGVLLLVGYIVGLGFKYAVGGGE